MTLATRTESTLNPNIAQTALYDAVKTALASAGFPAPLEEYTSVSDRYVIYELIQDATKNAGKVYLSLYVTSALSISYSIGATWNSTNKTLGSPSSSVSSGSLTPGTQIRLNAFNCGAEFRLLILTQSTTAFYVGVFSPANRPAWWDLTQWPYAFIPSASSFDSWRCPTNTPWGSSSFSTSLNSANLINANRATNERSVGESLVLFLPNGEGFGGNSSDDLCSIAATGLNRYQELNVATVPARKYLVLSATNGGLGVRTE